MGVVPLLQPALHTPLQPLLHLGRDAREEVHAQWQRRAHGMRHSKNCCGTGCIVELHESRALLLPLPITPNYCWPSLGACGVNQRTLLLLREWRC